MTLYEQIQEKLLALDAAIKEINPELPMLLKIIHNHLKKDPEIVTLLTEEEIAVIVEGLKLQTNTELSVAVARKRKKPLNQTTLNDLL